MTPLLGFQLGGATQPYNLITLIPEKCPSSGMCFCSCAYDAVAESGYFSVSFHMICQVMCLLCLVIFN